MMKITDKVYTIDELKAIVKPIMEQFSKVKALYVYSNYAYGTANSDSPILMHIEGEDLTTKEITYGKMNDELEANLCKEVVIYQESELYPERMAEIKKEEIMVYERR